MICLYTLKLNMREGGGSSFFTVKHIFSLKGFCIVLQLFHSFTLKEKCYHFQKQRHVEVLAPVTGNQYHFPVFLCFTLLTLICYLYYKVFQEGTAFFVCVFV